MIPEGKKPLLPCHTDELSESNALGLDKGATLLVAVLGACEPMRSNHGVIRY